MEIGLNGEAVGPFFTGGVFEVIRKLEDEKEVCFRFEFFDKLRVYKEFSVDVLLFYGSEVRILELTEEQKNDEITTHLKEILFLVCKNLY